jgi:hypothetical protein
MSLMTSQAGENHTFAKPCAQNGIGRTCYRHAAIHSLSSPRRKTDAAITNEEAKSSLN